MNGPSTISLIVSYVLQASQSTITPENLTLTAPTPDKVPGSYKQALRLNGHKTVIESSNYHTESGIYMYCHNVDQTSMSVPLDDWLRSQLSIVQDYVVSHASIPADVPQTKEGAYLFKPLLTRDTLMISLSKWCRIFKFDKSRGAYVRIDKFSQFRKGNFSVQIEASHVYIGPHKGGHSFSLSLRVKQIVYNEEEQEDDDTLLLNELLAAEVEIDKKAKRPKKARKTAECRKSGKAAVAAIEVK